MLVTSQCRYYPSSARQEHGSRTPRYWDSYKHAIAVKSASVNGYYSFPVAAGGYVKVSNSNIAMGRYLFGDWLGGQIESVGYDPLLVPIPSSKDGLVDAKDFRSFQMTRTAATRIAGAIVAPVLRFKTASQQRSRSIAALEANMVVLQPPPGKRVILVDDVLTTGAHLLAAERVLKREGIHVAAAYVCGRTVYDQTPPAFLTEAEELRDPVSIFFGS